MLRRMLLCGTVPTTTIPLAKLRRCGSDPIHAAILVGPSRAMHVACLMAGAIGVPRPVIGKARAHGPGLDRTLPS